ncbi:MAG: GNAT family N-acetyltransferase [Phycisphaerae bacterium]|nr:GNAT family N-acetyltransferase [Phycisphaerae bacterium]
MKDQKPELVEPCEELREAYIEYVKECREAGETMTPWVLDRPIDNFTSLLSWLKEQSKGIGIKEGFVSHSTFWLVDSNEQILGVTNLRHALTDHLWREGGHIGFGVRPSERGKGYATAMVKLVLKKAKSLGLEKVLITCDKDKPASARVIEKNGGKLDNELVSKESGKMKQRYWIEL